MRKLSATAALTTIAILLAPAVTAAQGNGTGSASPGSAGATLSQVTAPPAGTNSAGTAQSAGRPNTGEGVTTGSATTPSVDQAIADENRSVDRRLKGICRGC